MITLHLKLQNEYLKLNDYMEQGNITWGKNGDDGVSVTLKNVPNGKNLLADSLGQELVAYRGGELAWKGFVSNVTENENGIELVGRGDFHKLDYIEDFGKFYIQNTYESWGTANSSNTIYYPDLTVTSGAVIWMRAEDLNGSVYKWYDKRQNGVEFTAGPGVISNPLTTWRPAYSFQIDKLSALQIRNSSDIFPNYQIATLLSTSTTYPASAGHEFYFVLDALDGDGFGRYPTAPLLKYGPFEIIVTTDFTIVPYQYAKLTLVIRTTGSPSAVDVDLGYPDRTVDKTVLRVKLLSDNQTVEIYKDFQLYTTVNLANTVNTADNVIRFGNYNVNNLFDTSTVSHVYEFISYSGNLSTASVETLDKYFNEKYKLFQYNPSNFESVVIPYNVNPSDFTPSLESQVYMSLQNGDTFSLNNGYITYFKVPEVSAAGVNTAFFNLEYRLPSGFLVEGYYYSDDLSYTGLFGNESVLNSGTVQRFARTVNFNNSNNIRQINLQLIYAPFSSTLSPLSYTNTASNDYYYVKLSNFLASNLQLKNSKRYRLSEGSLSLEGGRVLYTVVKNNDVQVGGIVGFGANVTTIASYAYVETVNVVTKSSIEYTEFTCNNAVSYPSNTTFFVFTLSSSDVVNDIIQEYIPDSTLIVENQGDLLLNSTYDGENLKQSTQDIADSLGCRVYKQGKTTFFIRNPVNTYYLNQSSKSISQSFDKFYNRVRSNYKSIYELENTTAYVEKPSKIAIPKSKTVNLGTSSGKLADEIIQRVATEDIGSIVKVIPQTGELYNEYGAVVRDPKINSAVVLKNVVPELIGLGDKTYYLSEITYDFMTGQYEYVVDEPEITFELILSRTQN